MQVNDSRLIKAARRTIRAEVNLIIVIIILTSWSVYALYKLAVGGTDSILGLSISKTTSPQDFSDLKNRTLVNQLISKTQPQNLSPNQFGDLSQETNIRHQNNVSTDLTSSSPKSINEQLSHYKSQILKELISRQQGLLSGGQATINRPRLDISHENIRSERHDDDAGDKFNIDELKQWQGGFKFPQILDNRLSLKISTDIPSNDGSKLINTQPSFIRQRPPQDEQPTTDIDRKNVGLQDQRDSERVDKDINEYGENERHNSAPSDDSDSPSPNYKDYETNSVDIPAANIDNNASNNDQEFTPEEMGLISTTESSQTDQSTTPIPAAVTSTANPTILSDSQQGHNTEDVGQDQAESSDDTENSNDEASDNVDQEPGKIDDEALQRVKKTVHSIDEEVDRMTQPSSGMASRQDSPFDFRKAVQFDDDSTVDQVTDLRPKQQVITPNQQNTIRRPDDFNGNIATPTTNRDRPRVEANETDLIVDHDGPKPSISGHEIKSGETYLKQTMLSSKPQYFANKIVPPGVTKHTKVPDDRQQHFLLHNVDKKKRDKRSIRVGAPANKRRRNDDDDDGSDDDDDGSDDDENDSSIKDNFNYRIDVPELAKGQQNFNSITTNEPSLQELLAHKRLLDELQLSKLPSPVQTSKSTQDQYNSTLSKDQSPSGSQYSIDHGLLLYPASDDDHEHDHKSMSKKNSKSAKKKEKKKMTVAMKKGGHKKKKHKKEEKKYHKEKKFKGAKKGKKMKKGKGGKGGKKGSKFYKDKGFKKKGFKNIYVKNEFGQKKSYFDEFRDKDFKKKWKNFDDKYNYAQMKKWQAKELKGAKKLKDHGEKMKKYDKSKWKKKILAEKESHSSSKKKKSSDF